ncbi:hypothetical protein [Athalassotoga saccharophila]|uniref:hypothetical protein n=1 Tax=Athalassotoga saccharophila TaxID=1441386 RepID=UPI001E5B88BC|nr:hypothetical protein [Athalassotoga saccharophila]
MFIFLFFNNKRNIVLLKEKVVSTKDIPKSGNRKSYIKMYASFKFNSSKLMGGEDYVLEYILSGKILATRKIHFEEGIYDFSKLPRK